MSALIAMPAYRIPQHSASVIGSDNNAISAIQSARRCSFQEARREYEMAETLDGAYPSTDTYGD